MVPFKANYIIPERGVYLLRIIEIGDIGRHPFNYVEAFCEKVFNYKLGKFQTRCEIEKGSIITHISKNPLN